MSRIVVDAIRNSSASTDGITLASDGSVTFPGNATCSGTATGFGGGGKILQVLQTVKTDVQSFTVSSSSNYGDILGTVTNLSQAITLSNASNKVLVQGFISLGSSYSGNTSISVSLERDNAQITGAIADTDGTRRRNMFSAHLASSARGPVPFPFYFLDTPGDTNAHTYSIEISHQYAATGTYYVNRGNESDNNIYQTRGISVITAMEVAA